MYRVALIFSGFKFLGFPRFFHDPQKKFPGKNNSRTNLLHCRNLYTIYKHRLLHVMYYYVGAHLLKPSLSFKNKTKLEAKHSEIKR